MKVILGKETLPLGDMTRLTLLEQSGIKAILGQPLYAVDNFDPRDPDILLAFIWLAKRRNNPAGYTPERIPKFLEEVDELERSGATFTIETEEEEQPAQPSPPSLSGSAGNGSANAPPESEPTGNGGSPSGSETLPPASGSPRSSTTSQP